MTVGGDGRSVASLRLGEEVDVVCRGDSLVSSDGSRRFVVYGEPEWDWWVEVAPDGSELPGMWEFWDDGGLAVCMVV